MTKIWLMVCVVASVANISFLWENVGEKIGWLKAVPFLCSCFKAHLKADSGWRSHHDWSTSSSSRCNPPRWSKTLQIRILRQVAKGPGLVWTPDSRIKGARMDDQKSTMAGPSLPHHKHVLVLHTGWYLHEEPQGYPQGWDVLLAKLPSRTTNEVPWQDCSCQGTSEIPLLLLFVNWALERCLWWGSATTWFTLFTAKYQFVTKYYLLPTKY